MKNAILFAFAAFASAVIATPTFVTPGMILRRGLTDGQYQHLWSLGKNPVVDQTTAREWCFRNYRYQNVTNWLDIIGQSNDFARLSYTLQNQNFELTDTNAVLCAELSEARHDIGVITHKWNACTNAITGEISWLDAAYQNTALMARDCYDPMVKAYLQRTLIPQMTNRMDILSRVLPKQDE